MVQGTELPEAVPGPTVSRSMWISGPVPVSGVRLPLWPASSRKPQGAGNVSESDTLEAAERPKAQKTAPDLRAARAVHASLPMNVL